MFIENILWGMCYVKWWENKVKMKFLILRRFYFIEDIDRERGNFSVISVIREVYIGFYEII